VRSAQRPNLESDRVLGLVGDHRGHRQADVGAWGGGQPPEQRRDLRGEAAVGEVEHGPHRPPAAVVQAAQAVALVGELDGRLGQRSVGFIPEQRGHDLHRQGEPAAQLDQPGGAGRVVRHAGVTGSAVQRDREQPHRLLGVQDMQVQ
jgi:hypothetical protein